MLKSYRVGWWWWWPIRFYCQPQSQLALCFCFFFVLGLELDLWGLGLGLGLDNLTQSTVIEVKYGFHFSVIGNTTTNSINWLLDRLIQMD